MKDENKKKSQLIEELRELRRRVEEIESRDCLPGVLDTMDDGICIITPDYDIEYANTALQRQFGPFEGMKCYQYLQDRKGACPECVNREVFAGRAVRWEWYSEKTGRTYELMDNPLYKPDGAVSKLEVFRDITERKKAEQALLQSEERIRRQLMEIDAIYNTAGVGLCVLDRDLRFIRINEKIAEMNGVPVSGHIGRTIREIAPHLADKAEELAEQVFRTGEPLYDVEVSGTTSAQPGVYRYWIEQWVPLRDAEGNVVRVNVAVEEVTERLKAREAIIRSEASYKKLADGISDIFFALDLNLRYTFWNKASEGLLGLSSEEVLGKYILDIFPDNEQTRKAIKSYKRAIEKDETQTLINEFYFRESIYYLQMKIYPTGEGVAVFARDITFETQLQDLLVRQTAIQEAIMENTPAQLAYLDTEFNFVAVNISYASNAGYSKEALIGKNHFELFPDRENEAIFRRVRDTGDPVRYNDKPFLFPNQPERGVTYWDWSLIPVKQDSGFVQGLVFSLTETTDRVLAQEACHRYERLATLGELSGTISHELRNPLATIDNSVFVLRRRLPETDGKVKESLDRIKASVDRCVATIQSLLNLTRMKEPARLWLDLSALIEDALKQEELPQSIRQASHLPRAPVIVYADREQLMMCFGNIIRNAVEAMEGEGILTVTLGSFEGLAEISFGDTGPGISDGVMHNITKPLFSTKSAGAGLGLAIASQVAEKHGGGIKFNSTAGEGTTVTVYLPLSGGEGG
ncbi:MAG: PAS domain-containing protein [Dehalococcoidia bacterium]